MSKPEPAAQAKPANKWAKFQRYIIMGVLLFVGALYAWSAIYNSANLPDCDSKRARDTMSNVFQSNKLSPTRYNEIKTLSETKDEVRCTANLAMPDGGTLNADYRFYWEGSTVKVEYSLKR